MHMKITVPTTVLAIWITFNMNQPTFFPLMLAKFEYFAAKYTKIDFDLSVDPGFELGS